MKNMSPALEAYITDKVMPYVARQKPLSVVSNPTQCKYNGPNGTTCAIGSMIIDDYRDHLTEYEGKTGAYLFNNVPVAWWETDFREATSCLRTKEVEDMVNNVQTLHDSLTWESPSGGFLEALIKLTNEECPFTDLRKAFHILWT